MKALRFPLAGAMAMLLALALAGCQYDQGATTGAYHFNQLEATFEAPPSHLIQASKDAMADLKLQEIESRQTDMGGDVVGRTVDDKRVKVNIDSRSDVVTRVTINVGILGDETLSRQVLDKIRQFHPDVLVVDDGSTDDTPQILARRSDVKVIRHGTNMGYGRSLIDAFAYADDNGYDWVITMDCDEQHEPERIPDFVRAIEQDRHDVISGSRYLRPTCADDLPPGFALGTPTPNPFRDETAFALTVATPEPVRVAVYDVLGREVDVLHDGPLPAGTPVPFVWAPAAARAGAYLLRVEGPGFRVTRKVVRVR